MNANLIRNIVAVAVNVWPQQIARMRFARVILTHADDFAAFEGEGKVAAADGRGYFNKAGCFHAARLGKMPQIAREFCIRRLSCRFIGGLEDLFSHFCRPARIQIGIRNSASNGVFSFD